MGRGGVRCLCDEFIECGQERDSGGRRFLRELCAGSGDGVLPDAGSVKTCLFASWQMEEICFWVGRRREGPRESGSSIAQDSEEVSKGYD